MRRGSGQRLVSPREKTKKRKPTANEDCRSLCYPLHEGPRKPATTLPLKEKRPSRKVAATEALQKQNLLGLAEGLQVYAELLALFVEMTALEAEGAGDVGHMEIVAADFGEKDFALESFGALDESSLLRGGFCSGGGINRGAVCGGEGEANVLVGNGVFGGEQGEAFDDIAKFADVAGPAIAAQLRDRVVGKGFVFPAVLLGDLVGKMGDELGEIFEAIAQRRQGQRENVDAVEEVTAEFVISDAVFEVAVSGHDDADTDLDGLIATDAFDFTFFEDAKKLGLHGDGHIADLVEEESAALGLLEFSDVASGRAGESTFFVAEEFGLDQFGGNGGAIECDEGVFVARRFLVNGARD